MKNVGIFLHFEVLPHCSPLKPNALSYIRHPSWRLFKVQKSLTSRVHYCTVSKLKLYQTVKLGREQCRAQKVSFGLISNAQARLAFGEGSLVGFCCSP